MAKFSLAGSTALALIFISHAAQAQVTAEEVWASWKEASSAAGQTITTTSEARDGDTLVVEGVTLAMDDGKGLVANSAIGTIRFRDSGTGTVEVALPESYPVTMTIPPTDTADTAGPTKLALQISQPGIKITAGGNATDTSYDFTAPTITVAVTEVANGSGPQDVKGDVTLSGVSGRYQMTGATNARALESSFAATNATITASGTEAENTFSANVKMENLKGETKGNLLGPDMMANMALALNSGFATDGSVTYGKTTFEVNATESGAPSKVVGTMDGGNLDVALDKTRLKYAIGLMAADYTVSGANIPVPEVNLGFGEFAFNFLMPVAKGDAPQDFTFLTKLVDLKVSDEVWGMFDPTGQLPRDPATLILDTKGKVTLTQDVMDPGSAMAMEGVPPGQINALDLNEVRLKVAGAEVAGVGALTFDNSDMTTFPGVPAPTGKVDMTLTGINALMDTLVAMGFVPEDQVMGARMMLAMFAKPGDAPDTLVSTIEFKDKGLYANGQRLQ